MELRIYNDITHLIGAPVTVWVTNRITIFFIRGRTIPTNAHNYSSWYHVFSMQHTTHTIDTQAITINLTTGNWSTPKGGARHNLTPSQYILQRLKNRTSRLAPAVVGAVHRRWVRVGVGLAGQGQLRADGGA